MKPRVFVDTSFFKGLLDLEDDFHKKAEKVSRELEIKEAILVTSNFVIDESYTLLRVRCGLDAAKKLRELLFSGGGQIQIIRIQAQDEAKAWEMFLNPWKGLSFTDCTSFAVMKRLGLTQVAAFDDHFSKAGFKIFT